MDIKLTIKQERFAQEYITLGSASAAYRAVYDASNMTDEAVHVCASRLKAKVWLRIKELQEAEAKQYQMSRAEVLNSWMKIATADVNEIVQIRRKCCSDCYGGENHKEPNLDCRRCLGEGEPYIYITDTRFLVGAARLLFAGARKTRNGVEVILRDQSAALVNIARALGVFDGQGYVFSESKSLLDIKWPQDPVEASKIYQQIMTGKITC